MYFTTNRFSMSDWYLCEWKSCLQIFASFTWIMLLIFLMLSYKYEWIEDLFTWNFDKSLATFMGNIMVAKWGQASLHNQSNFVNISPWISFHWGRVTHTCVSKIIIIGSDNGLSPGRRQAIIWTNTGIFLIGPIETNFNEILSEIIIFSFKKNTLQCVVCEMAAILSRPQCVN